MSDTPSDTIRAKLDALAAAPPDPATPAGELRETAAWLREIADCIQALSVHAGDRGRRALLSTKVRARAVLLETVAAAEGGPP